MSEDILIQYKIAAQEFAECTRSLPKDEYLAVMTKLFDGINEINRGATFYRDDLNFPKPE